MDGWPVPKLSGEYLELKRIDYAQGLFPTAPLSGYRRVIDKTKSSAIRKPSQAFLDYVKTVLTLSNNTISREMREAFAREIDAPYGYTRYHYIPDILVERDVDVYNHMVSKEFDPEVFPVILCALVRQPKFYDHVLADGGLEVMFNTFKKSYIDMLYAIAKPYRWDSVPCEGRPIKDFKTQAEVLFNV